MQRPNPNEIENLEDVERTLERSMNSEQRARYSDAMREHRRVCAEARANAATQELKVLEYDEHACSGVRLL